MEKYSFIVVDILIALGAAIMLIATVSTYKLIKKIKSSRYEKQWEMLLVFMILFFLGYISILFFLKEGDRLLFSYLVGFIFFFGALFVFLVVHTGRKTIVDLLNTTVSKAYVENVIHSMADTLIVIDTDENASVRTVNNAALNLLKYQENDLVGHSVKKILSPNLFSKAHVLELNDLDEVKDLETSYITQDGEEIPISFSSSVLRDIGGNIEGVIYVAQDIRERKQAEEKIKKYVMQLKESEEKLKEMNASKDKFFSIIAHDLRNPFGSVLGYSEIISQDCETLDKAELKDFAEMLHKQAKTIYDLLENLLTWSRVQTGRMVYNPEHLNLEEKMMKVYYLYKEISEKKNVELTVNCEVRSLVFVDDNMIFTVMRNLVSNAVKFSPQNGMIKLIAKEDNKQVIVSVEDTGVGMTEEDQQKLFKIGVQHSTMGTENEKGTGLGLILCKELVEKNGGNIWVESKLGRGSKFIFTIPKG